jgi:hypothetical protein
LQKNIDYAEYFEYDHTGSMRMNERITVTMPQEIVRDIDRRERNRSKFILKAVENELERQRKEELRRSLRTPHLESEPMAKLGTAEWMAELPAGDEDLVDPNAGESVRWIPDKGWLKEV